MTVIDDREKCEVKGRIIEPCKFLRDACEFGNPRGKKKGIFCWDFFKLSSAGRENTTRFFGVQTTRYPNGIKFEYCPFCGVSHSLPEKNSALEDKPDPMGR
jgi:hypothetical protein